MLILIKSDYNYGNRIRAKYTAKRGVQIAGMIFQTRSKIEKEIRIKMEREILAYIKQNRMIGKNDVVLAGVSGGSDSMAMLRILKELQGKLDFTLRVVHIHHGIRGKEADRDQSFVENICRKWQIPCTVYCYDVPGLSREWKLGEEETGRIVRKEAFQREAAVCGRKDSEIKIALAHNQEDLAETMLHNLCRGTGLRGLCTMRPVDGEIIRPILC